MIKEKFSYFLVIVFVIISLAISFYTLTRQSIRLDEAQSLWVAAKTIPGILAYISMDVHVPLYELILHSWLQIFGINIIWARILSYIFFIASLPVLYFVSRQATSKTIALLTVMLYSLSPFIVWYSFEARMYTLFTLVTCISHYFFLKIIKTNGQRGEVGYFFSTLLGLFTHYFFTLLILSQIVYLFIWIQDKKSEQWVIFEEYKPKELLKNIFIPLFLAGLFFVPWGIYFIIQGAAAATQPLIPPSSVYNLLQTVINFLFGFQSATVQTLLIALWPLSVIPIFFIFSKRKAEIPFNNIKYFIVVTLFPIILVFVISFIKPVFLIRYLIFTAPSFFIIFSWILFQLSRQISQALLVLFAFIMLGFLFFQNASNATPVKEDYRGAANYISKKASAGDVIAISSPFTIYPFEYYYKGQAVIETIPFWDVYKSGRISKFSTERLKTQINNYSKNYNNVYIILSYDQGYEKKIINYMDTHYQRLDLKVFSPGLSLREYKLKY